MAAESRRDRSLESMSRRIREARTAVDRCRNGPVSRDELADARHELMLALRDYVAALERKNLPVPWRMQAELKLHRDLFDR